MPNIKQKDIIISFVIAGLLIIIARNRKKIAEAGTEAFTAVKNFLGQLGLPRGMRNNNPGNIRTGPIRWRGKIPVEENTDTNKEFEQFIDYPHGIRAMIKVIQTYQRDGLRTISEIINRYAPPIENATDVYVSTVANETGLNKDAPFSFNKNDLQKLVIAMTAVENGRPAVEVSDFNQAWDLL